jgi:hypothetical protein
LHISAKVGCKILIANSWCWGPSSYEGTRNNKIVVVFLYISKYYMYPRLKYLQMDQSKAQKYASKYYEQGGNG